MLTFVAMVAESVAEAIAKLHRNEAQHSHMKAIPSLEIYIHGIISETLLEFLKVVALHGSAEQ